MNANFHTTFDQQWQLTVSNSSRDQFEEIGMHKLWRRSSPTVKAFSNPVPKILWPIQAVLDKVERFVSETLFWQFIGRFDRLSAPVSINLNRYLSLSSLGGTHFRLQYGMPHLTSHQRKQRIDLISWLMTDYESRFTTCQEQWRSLTLDRSTASPKSPVRPQWIVDSIASCYLERLRGWIEDAYDLKKIPPHIPLPLHQSSNSQLCDISVGVKILLTQFEVRTTEVALSKYIVRYNWGRWLVKMTFLAPIISLIARRVLFIQLPILTMGAAGLAGAVAFWITGYQLYWNETNRSSDLFCRILDLVINLHELESNAQARESAKSNVKRQERASHPNSQKPCQEQSKKTASATISEEEESRKIEAMQKKIAKLQAEGEKEIQRNKKILQDLQKERQNNKKKREWLKKKIRSLGIQIDYSQEPPRLIFPLRIKGPEQQHSAVGFSLNSSTQ